MTNRIFAAATVAVLLLALLASCVYPPIDGGVGTMAIERGALLCATEDGNCVESWNGADIVMYSDDGSTQTFAVDGATGAIDMEAGMAVGGELVVGADGTSHDVIFYSDTAGDYLRYDQSDEALVITGTNAATALNVTDGNVVVNDDLTVTAGAFDVTAGATTVEALSVGVAGTGADVYFYSDTSGDHLFWDTSDEVLNIIGTNAQTALNVSDGNFVVADTIDANGDIDLDGTGLDADVTGAISLDADLASNFNAAAGDITVEAETGSIVIKADEAVADALYLDLDEDAATGLDIDVGATNGVSIDGGLVDIGTGTYATADGDKDLGVAGDLEVDGSTDLDGALAVAGNVDVTGTLQYGANDLYPIGFASSGQQTVYGTTAITGTATAAHGLTTVTFCLCTLGKQQDASTAGCSVVVSSNTCTLYTYEDDNTTQSTETDVPVHWLVIGAP